MNVLPFALIPNAAMWNSLRSLHYHPDIEYDNNGIGYVEDLRKNYLPAESYGSVYYPFVKPVIATMPGLQELCPNAYDFFGAREIYLINSPKFLIGAATITAFTVAAVFAATLMPHILWTIGTGVALYGIYSVINEIIIRYFEGKADDFAIANAIPNGREEALGLIEALQEKAKKNPAIRPYQGLKEKLIQAGVKSKPVPADLFHEHDERESSLGLDYTMRPAKESLLNEETESLFYKREAFHYQLDKNEMLKIACSVGFITLTGTLMPALFTSPLIYIIAPAAFCGFYALAHFVADHVFKLLHDPKALLSEEIGSNPGVYRGSYIRCF